MSVFRCSETLRWETNRARSRPLRKNSALVRRSPTSFRRTGRKENQLIRLPSWRRRRKPSRGDELNIFDNTRKIPSHRNATVENKRSPVGRSQKEI